MGKAYQRDRNLKFLGLVGNIGGLLRGYQP